MLCIVLLKLFHDSASDSFDRVYRPNRLASVQMIGEPSVLRSFANHPPVLSFVAHLVLVSSWYGEENGYPDVNESPEQTIATCTSAGSTIEEIANEIINEKTINNDNDDFDDDDDYYNEDNNNMLR